MSCRRTCTTGNDLKIGRGIDRTPVDDHPEIQMRAISKATPADGCNAFPSRDRLGTLREHRCDKSEVTVDTDKSIVLDQHLKAPNPMALNPNDPPGRNCQNRATDRRGKIDPVMERTGQWPIRQRTRAKW
jgi:hypothetical protein